MPANVGTAPVQFYLGANPVSAYLGATPVARTLYYNGAVDTNWNTLGNWWLDSGHTVAAPSLPAAGDSVIATANIASNSGGAVTVVNFTLSGTSKSLQISITVTGMTTFNDSSSTSNVTVTGNATFNDTSRIAFGTLIGNATFNDSSDNDASTISGDATFNDSSRNLTDSTVTGDATFNDSSRNQGASVTGTATFTGSACNASGTAGTFVPDPPPTCA